jgi:hypothetical protein
MQATCSSSVSAAHQRLARPCLYTCSVRAAAFKPAHGGVLSQRWIQVTPSLGRLNATGDAEPGTASKPEVPNTPPSSSSGQLQKSSSSSSSSQPILPQGTDPPFSWAEFIKSDLPNKLGVLVGLIVLSRVGVYIRIPGVDVEAFSSTMQNNGLMTSTVGQRQLGGLRPCCWRKSCISYMLAADHNWHDAMMATLSHKTTTDRPPCWGLGLPPRGIAHAWQLSGYPLHCHACCPCPPEFQTLSYDSSAGTKCSASSRDAWRTPRMSRPCPASPILAQSTHAWDWRASIHPH